MAFVAPASANYAFATLRSASDPNLAVYDGCDGEELGCSYDRESKGLVTAELSAGQSALVVIDGGGDFVLDVFEVEPSELDCADGRDEDLDRAPDCLDPDCAGEPGCAPQCPDQVGLGASIRLEASTVGSTDDYLPKCNAPYVIGPTSDLELSFTAPGAGRYGIAVQGAGFEPHFALLDGCGGLELGCSFGGPLTVDLLAGQTVLAVVDGWYASPEGVFSVDFFRIEDRETSCVDGLDNDLEGGADCRDPACDRDPACLEDCSDGLDDDGDGRVDCADPGCAADPRCVESRCSDGRDDDGDQRTDCVDPDCDRDPACDEGCADGRDGDGDGAIDCLDGGCRGDPICVATCPDDALERPGTLRGATVGRPDRMAPSCGTGPASDWSVAFTAPSDGRYLFDTAGSTSSGALAITDQCGGPELGCDRPPFGSPARVAVDLVAGQTAIAVLDSGWPSGKFDLHVSEVPSEERDCSDGLDGDVDGSADCSDPDCRVDPICAEDCSDGLDDNGDGRVDCADPVCDCRSICPEEALVGPLPLSVAGSTVGLGADWTASCGNGAPGADLTFAFVAPSAGNYTFDTRGSSFDTVLSVRDGCGGPTLACNDDLPSAPGPSRVEVPLAEGQAVIVILDGYGEEGDYVLEVR